MPRGRKTGGRVAGTPNKRTQEVAELLESLGCNPIEGMARIAMDEKHTPELRGRMFAELAQYVAPKRKAMELAAAPDAPPQSRLIVEFVKAKPVPPLDGAEAAVNSPFQPSRHGSSG